MKIKYILAIITILNFAHIYGQNKTEVVSGNYLTKDQLFDSIKKSIELNNPESIYKLVDSNYSTQIKLEELNFNVNAIYNLLRKHNIKKLDSIFKSSSSSFSYINGLTKKTFQNNYILFPEYLNDSVRSLFFEVPKYEILLALSQHNNKWYLSNLYLDDKYADSNYEMNQQITNFFNKTDTLTIKYSILKNNKIKNSQLNTVDNDIRDLLNRLEYIKFSDVEISKILKNSTMIYSLSLQSNNLDASFHNTFNKNFNDKIVTKFDFLFYKNNPSIILVSNNNKYAFYKFKYFKELKEICMKRINLKTK